MTFPMAGDSTMFHVEQKPICSTWNKVHAEIGQERSLPGRNFSGTSRNIALRQHGNLSRGGGCRLKAFVSSCLPVVVALGNSRVRFSTAPISRTLGTLHVARSCGGLLAPGRACSPLGGLACSCAGLFAPVLICSLLC